MAIISQRHATRHTGQSRFAASRRCACSQVTVLLVDFNAMTILLKRKPRRFTFACAISKRTEHRYEVGVIHIALYTNKLMGTKDNLLYNKADPILGSFYVSPWQQLQEMCSNCLRLTNMQRTQIYALSQRNL